MSSRRVVVTGMGALTPIGNNLNSYWNGLINGTSGCASITQFDASNFKTKFACELKGFDPADHFERKEYRRYDKFSQYGIVAASEAIDDSKIIDSSEKINNQIETAFLQKNTGILGITSSLATYHLLYDDTSLINDEIEIYRSITREDIMKAVSYTHLTLPTKA